MLSNADDKEWHMLYVPCAHEKEAKKITTLLLEANICVCVNISTNVDSHYWWQSELCEASEAVMIIKTRVPSDASALIRTYHSYDEPVIMSWPVCHR